MEAIAFVGVATDPLADRVAVGWAKRVSFAQRVLRRLAAQRGANGALAKRRLSAPEAQPVARLP